MPDDPKMSPLRGNNFKYARPIADDDALKFRDLLISQKHWLEEMTKRLHGDPDEGVEPTMAFDSDTPPNRPEDKPEWFDLWMQGSMDHLRGMLALSNWRIAKNEAIWTEERVLLEAELEKERNQHDSTTTELLAYKARWGPGIHREDEERGQPVTTEQPEPRLPPPRRPRPEMAL